MSLASGACSIVRRRITANSPVISPRFVEAVSASESPVADRALGALARLGVRAREREHQRLARQTERAAGAGEAVEHDALRRGVGAVPREQCVLGTRTGDPHGRRCGQQHQLDHDQGERCADESGDRAHQETLLRPSSAIANAAPAKAAHRAKAERNARAAVRPTVPTS